MPANYQTSTGALLVFAKPAKAGEVKTRLIPELGAAGAAALYRRLHDRVLATAGQSGFAQLQYWQVGDVEQTAIGPPWVRFVQQGADLGERMLHALDTALCKYPYAVVIGTDCPALTVDDLRAARRLLDAGKDAVLSPAEDGGYVLLGVRQAVPELFSGVSWGTDAVLTATRRAMLALGWDWEELPVRWDVDRPADLQRLAALAIEIPGRKAG